MVRKMVKQLRQKRQTHGERIMQPIPGKVIASGVKCVEPVNGYIMNSGQIAEDYVDKLLIRSTVTVNKCPKSLGVLCPTVAHDKHIRHVWCCCIRRIRRVHTVSLQKRVEIC